MSHSTLGRVSNPTLRVLADLPRQPVSLSESTLILIDCQNTYTRGVMELDGVQEALDEAAALLDRARSAGIPIIHIQLCTINLFEYRLQSPSRVPRRIGTPALHLTR